MGRYTGPTDKLSRREGINLMLKGARSESGKLERRMTPPGQHHWRRARHSDYGVRLREKQKVKRYYGIRDKQFMNCFHEATRIKGNTGEALLRHEAEEGGVVIQGELEVTVGDQRRVLRAGDAFYFDSRLPHRFRNPGEVEAIVVTACTPPSF